MFIVDMRRIIFDPGDLFSENPMLLLFSFVDSYKALVLKSLMSKY